MTDLLRRLVELGAAPPSGDPDNPEVGSLFRLRPASGTHEGHWWVVKVAEVDHERRKARVAILMSRPTRPKWVDFSRLAPRHLNEHGNEPPRV